MNTYTVKCHLYKQDIITACGCFNLIFVHISFINTNLYFENSFQMEILRKKIFSEKYLTVYIQMIKKYMYRTFNHLNIYC